MTLDLYIEEQQFCCEMDEAINLFKESMNNFNITCQEIALAEMQNSVLTESVGFLYEDAAEAANAANKTVIGKIISAIGGFVKKIINKIRNFFSSKKLEEDLNEIKNDVEKNPELGQKKVEMIDIKALTDRQKKYFDSVKNIIAKQQAGQPLKSSEMKKLDAWLNNEIGKIHAKKIIIPVSAALAAVGGAIAYCKASDKTVSDIGSAIKSKVTKVVGNVNHSVATKIEDARYKKDLERIAPENKMDDDAVSNASAQLREAQSQLVEINKKYTEDIAAIEACIQNMKDALGKMNEGSKEYADQSEQLKNEESRKKTAEQHYGYQKRQKEKEISKLTDEIKSHRDAAQKRTKEVEDSHDFKQKKNNLRHTISQIDASITEDKYAFKPDDKMAEDAIKKSEESMKKKG